MTFYFSITSFRNSINNLTSKPKNGYKTVWGDICDDFISKDIDSIRQNRDLIINEDEFNIIKLRIRNSGSHLSKADGFRLVYYISKKEDKVIFMDIYPKRGKMGLINMTDSQLKELLRETISEIKTSSIVQHDINSDLANLQFNEMENPKN